MTQDAKPLTASIIADRLECFEEVVGDEVEECLLRDARVFINQQAAELSELANACHVLLHTHEHPPELTPMHSFSPAAARVYELASRVVEPRALAARSENA